MSLVYLLDTNVISEPLKDLPNSKVLDNIERYHDKIAIPVFVVYELIKGARQLSESVKQRRILHYIDKVVFQLPILSYTDSIAIWHGEEMARLQGLGKTAPFLDSQIAAIAAGNDLVLVTRNTRDFQNFNDLSLENWFD
ncbi:MAG: type II toxin-antitoxin system VapC family toxin [Methyloprofundus sp.]|nr:type II toxin-antitoxin system VapC family toxin [Methyloprofundus sp.]